MGNKNSASRKGTRKDDDTKGTRYGLVSGDGGASDQSGNHGQCSSQDPEFVFHSFQKSLSLDDISGLMDFVEETGVVRIDSKILLMNRLLCSHGWFTGKSVGESLVLPNQLQTGVNALNPELFVVINKKKYKQRKRLDKLISQAEALQARMEKDRDAAAATAEDSDEQYDDLSSLHGIPLSNLEYSRIVSDQDVTEVVRAPRGQIPLLKRYEPVQGRRVTTSYPLGVLQSQTREITVQSLQCFAVLIALGVHLSTPAVSADCPQAENLTVIPPYYLIAHFNNQVWLLLLYLSVLRTEYPALYQEQQQMQFSSTLDPIKFDVLLSSYNLIPVTTGCPSATILQHSHDTPALINIPSELNIVLQRIVQYMFLAPFISSANRTGNPHCIEWRDMDVSSLHAEFQRFNATRLEHLHLFYVLVVRGLRSTTIVPNLALILDKDMLQHVFPEFESIEWSFDPMELDTAVTILILIRILTLEKSNVDTSIYVLKSLVSEECFFNCRTVHHAILFYLRQNGLQVSESTIVASTPDWEISSLVQAQFDDMLNPEELDPVKLQVSEILKQGASHYNVRRFVNEEFQLDSDVDRAWLHRLHTQKVLLDESTELSDNLPEATTKPPSSYYYDDSSDEQSQQADQLDSIQELINQINAEKK